MNCIIIVYLLGLFQVGSQPHKVWDIGKFSRDCKDYYATGD